MLSGGKFSAPTVNVKTMHGKGSSREDEVTFFSKASGEFNQPQV